LDKTDAVLGVLNGYIGISNGLYLNVVKFAIYAVGVIAMVAGLVLAIMSFCDFWEKPNNTTQETITYSQIPRVIVHLEYGGEGNTEKYYMPYYAAENITPASLEKKTYASGSEDSLIKYGDLNGLCNHCAWLTLYTTKDANAGKPLTPDFKVYTVTDHTVPEDYLGIHMFSNTNAANLNQFQLNNAGALYVYVKPFVASTGTGSVFSNSVSAMALLCLGVFALGAGLSSVVTAGYYRKKERKTA